MLVSGKNTFPSLFQNQDRTMLAIKLLTEFLAHTQRIKTTEEHLAVTCFDIYFELISILEHAKLYDQAIAVNKEFIGLIERLTEPNLINYLRMVKHQFEQKRDQLKLLKEKADKKYQKDLARIASFVMIAVVATSVLAFIYKKKN